MTFSGSGDSSAGSPASNAYATPWGFPPGQFDGLSLASSSLHQSGYSGIPNNHSQTPSSASGGASGLFNSFPSTVNATQGSIEDNILRQVETNLNTEEYVWAPADASLYEIGNTRAIQAISLPGSIRMVFPPHTMIMAWEKDGSMASPAFRPLHPHSNQW